MLIEPLLTALFAWVIFGEKLSPLNWIAFFLVLTGIYIAKLSIARYRDWETQEWKQTLWFLDTMYSRH